MIRRSFLVGMVLLLATTLLSIGSFRLYYGDFFYLRRVHRSATEKDHNRLLRIADELDYYDQGNTSASMMLAEALLRVDEKELATEIISEQVALNPESSGILQAYAEALAAQGRAEEADRIFRKMLESLRQDEPRSEAKPILRGERGRDVKEGS